MKRYASIVEAGLVGLILAVAFAACSPESACGRCATGGSGTSYSASGAACPKEAGCPAGRECAASQGCSASRNCGAAQGCGVCATVASGANGGSSGDCCGRPGCACPRRGGDNATPATSTAGPSAGAASAAAPAVATVGSPAPDFSLSDVAGRRVSLADFRGKVTVLEWINPGCPFVKRHYEGGGIPTLVREATGQGVAWLTIQSTRRDHAQYAEPGALEAKIRGWRSTPTAILVDPDGAVGRLYAAKTTPHLFVIDASGRLVYAGAIDSDPSGGATSPTNYVRQALADLAAGRVVATSQTQSYGCGVKY